MAIYKARASDLYEDGETYVVVPSATISLFRSVAAIAIYLYLQDKPEDWELREADVMNRFEGLGRRRYREGIAELKELGLLRSIRLAGGGGKFTGHQYDLFAHPSLNPHCRHTHKSQSGTCGEAISHENHKSQNPPGGKRTHLNINRSFKHRQIDTHGGEARPTKAISTRSTTLEEDLTDFRWAK